MIAFLGMPVKGLAQVDPAHIDTSAARTHGMRGFTTFDPAIYQVQKRYRPWEGDSAWTGEWWRHITVGASTGIDVFHNFSAKQTTLQIPINAFVGYQFTPIHELRLQGGFEAVKEKMTNGTFTAYNAELQYLANMSNFMLGYNPGRRLNVSTLVALGTRIYGRNSFKGFDDQDYQLEHKLTPYAKFGANIDYKISPNVSFFVQPFIGLQRSQTNIFNSEKQDNYDFFGGVHSGFYANLTDSKKYYEEMAPRFHSIFLELGTGWNFDMSNFDKNFSGNSYNVGIGRWVDPVFGFKLNLVGQQGYWNKDEYFEGYDNYRFRKSYVNVGVSGEVMFGLLNFLNKRRHSVEDPLFDLNVSGGVKFGVVGLYDAQNNTGSHHRLTSYYGFTGGLQGLLKVGPGSYIYAEPRFSYLLYNGSNAYYGWDATVGKKLMQITDNGYMTLNVGTRIYAATKADRMLNDNDFTRNWWVGADFGGMKLYQPHRMMGEGMKIQPAVGLSVGYDLNPYASFRFQTEWQMYARTVLDGNVTTKYSMLDFRPMYMLSITNLLRGYDSQNRFQAYFELGPTLSIYTSQKADGNTTEVRRVGKLAPGVMTGITMAYKFAPQWDVFAEVQGQFNFNKDIDISFAGNPTNTLGYNFIAPNTINSRSWVQNLKYGLYAGARYHFLPTDAETRQRLHLDVPDWQSGWFFEAGTGWSNPFKEMSGNKYKASFGRWVSPIFAFRFGLQGQQHYHNFTQMSETKRQYNAQLAAYGHLELVTDVLNWFPSLRGRERTFDLNLFAGLALGAQASNYDQRISSGADNSRMKEEMNVSFGLTAGLQGLVRVAPGVQLYVEPSIIGIRDGVSHKVGLGEITDMPLAISAGARITRADDARSLRRAGYLGDDIENGVNAKFKPSWWVGLQVGGSKYFRAQKIVNDDIKGLTEIQPTFSMSIAREFTSLSTLRAQLEYSRMNKMLPGANDVKHYDQVDLSLMYMLNFTNLWRGTRNQPRFSYYPEIGATFAYKNYSTVRSGKDKVFGLMAGMMASYRINDEWDITAESQFYQYINAETFMNQPYESGRANQKWNLSLGTRYHLPEGVAARRQLNLQLADWQKGWFFEAGAGVSHPLDHKSGNMYKVSLGHWFSSLFGLRFGFQGQQLYHQAVQQEDRTQYNTQVAATGHLELITSVLNWFPGIRAKQDDHVFDINLFAGLNAGVQAANYNWENTGSIGASLHEGDAGHEIGYTIGFNAGMQILGRVAPNVYVFVEPSLQTVQNRVGKYNSSSISDTQSDKLFAVSVGTRLTRSDDAKALRKAGFNGDAIEGGLNAKFEQNWWASAQVGGSKRFLCQKYIYDGESGSGLNPTFSISGGRDFTPLSSLRAQFETSFFNDRGEGALRKYNFYDLRLLYMLNLTNLWRGTRNVPRFSLYPEFGPAFSFKSKMSKWDKHSRCSFGLTAGIMASYRVAEQFDLIAESQFQQHFTEKFMNQHHDKEANQKWNFTLGLRYHIKLAK